MKGLSLLLIGLCFISFAKAQAIPVGNFSNGSFEDWDGELPANWKIEGTNTWQKETMVSFVRSGANSVKVTVPIYSDFIYQVLGSVVAEADLTVSGYVRDNDVSHVPAIISLRWYIDNTYNSTTEINRVTTTTSWQNISGTVTVPIGINNASVAINVDAARSVHEPNTAYTLYIDDVSVTGDALPEFAPTQFLLILIYVPVCLIVFFQRKERKVL